MLFSISVHVFLFRLRVHRHNEKKIENPSLITLILLKFTPLVALPARRCCCIGRCFRPSPLISSSTGKCPRRLTQPHSIALWPLAGRLIRSSICRFCAAVGGWLSASLAGASSSPTSPWVERRCKKYRRRTTSCAGGTSSWGLRFLARAYAVAQIETPDASAA
jgi:hypothetical protein